MIEELGWQAHTVRGAMVGALKMWLGLDDTSARIDGRGRIYRIADGRRRRCQSVPSGAVLEPSRTGVRSWTALLGRHRAVSQPHSPHDSRLPIDLIRQYELSFARL